MPLSYKMYVRLEFCALGEKDGIQDPKKQQRWHLDRIQAKNPHLNGIKKALEGGAD